MATISHFGRVEWEIAFDSNRILDKLVFDTIEMMDKLKMANESMHKINGWRQIVTKSNFKLEKRPACWWSAFRAVHIPTIYLMCFGRHSLSNSLVSCSIIFIIIFHWLLLTLWILVLFQCVAILCRTRCCCCSYVAFILSSSTIFRCYSISNIFVAI